jgi:hypothetical protein
VSLKVISHPGHLAGADHLELAVGAVVDSVSGVTNYIAHAPA